MNSTNEQRKRILSRLRAEEFVGRTHEIYKILRHAGKKEQNYGLLLLSGPGNGISELLTQVYDHLFSMRGAVIPFYFCFSASDIDATQTARRFLQEFLLQTVAFRLNDPKLLDSSPEICEIAELSAPEDGHWIDRLVSTCEIPGRLADDRSFVRNALSGPLRANAHGARSIVLIDNFHLLEQITGGNQLLEDLKEIYQRSTIPFVFAGRRRHVLDAVQAGSMRMQNFEKMHLDELPSSDAGLLIQRLSRESEVIVNERTSDLIIQQFEGNPFFISTLFSPSRTEKPALDSFQSVEQVYVESLMGGEIGKFFNTIFTELAPDFESRTKLLKLLSRVERLDLEEWFKKSGLPNEGFKRLIKLLNIHEIVRVNAGSVEVSDNWILRDYITASYRLEIDADSRALVFGNMLTESLKRAPATMTEYYRRSAALGLRELLAVFNCQEVPASLLDYSIFKDRFKGLDEAEILTGLGKAEPKITLPHIVYSASCASFYPPLNQFTEKQRAALALGFESTTYTTENEIAWIGVEIDSKLEATREVTEFWCDRLEMVALSCNFRNYKLWLIAPEGFSPEGHEILAERHALGSSRQQAGLLIKYLSAEGPLGESLRANEYEMVLPMGDDTEMIAAHAIEDIARRYDFPTKAINQIKTALVEACINAAEHSLSVDRRIYQKFTVEDDRIIISISNRGVKIPSNKVAESALEIDPDQGRRGWGLKLMRSLMDEVKFEQIDDGTRISMVKYLKK